MIDIDKEGNAADFRWPVVCGERALEVWYSLVGPADRPVAFWYRYTLLSTSGGHQEARVWAAFTDGERPERSFLVTRKFSLDEVTLDRDPFRIRIGEDAELTDASAKGMLPGPLGPIRWDLAYDPDPESFTLIGNTTVYDLAVKAGVTRHRSVNEAVRMKGYVELGDERFELDEAPGHQGHTAGTRLVPSWAWVQCNGFEDPEVALEVLAFRGLVTVCLRENGNIHRLNTMKNLVGFGRNRCVVTPGEIRKIVAKGPGVRVEAECWVENPATWQRAVYRSPDDTLRYNAHCSVARVRLTYQVAGPDGRLGPSRTVESGAGRAEWVDVAAPIEGHYLPDDWDAETSGGLHGR